MDAKQFRELLEVAKEFKLERFETNDLKVVFTPNSFYNIEKPDMALANTQDADELVLAHIEKLKSQAIGGFTQV